MLHKLCLGLSKFIKYSILCTDGRANVTTQQKATIQWSKVSRKLVKQCCT